MIENGALNGVTPADVLITSEVLRRPEGRLCLEQELRAFCELASIMTADCKRAVRRFLELAMELCGAGSAGISVLRADASGELMFHWDALAGAFAPYEGGTTPRDFSPCGLCLDAGTAIAVSRPARLFTYFEHATPSIIEGLIVPLYDNARRPLGTLWVVHHDEARQFTPNDVRVMEELASQLVLALKLIEEREAQRVAWSTLEREREAVAADLGRERAERERAEASASGLWQVVNAKEMLIHEINHRVKNSIQTTMSLLSLQSRATQSKEAQDVLQKAEMRLHVLAKVHELLYRGAADSQAVLIRSLLQSLTAALHESYSSTHPRVGLESDICDVCLHPDQAIPLALMVNELITNAYKHGFQRDETGEVVVRLSPADSDAFVLVVRDNGSGFDKSPRPNGLGMRLVRSLADQLQGTLVLDGTSGVGTVATVTFPASSQTESRPIPDLVPAR